MKFLPVYFGIKYQTSAVGSQTDILRIGRFAYAAGNPKHSLKALGNHFYCDITSALHFLFDIVGINIPGVEQTGNIFIQMETVHGSSGKFPSGFF